MVIEYQEVYDKRGRRVPDYAALKEMLRAGIPGPEIKRFLGLSEHDQSVLGKAWRITRRRGRPAKETVR